MQVKRALLSVYDKTGIVEFAKELQNLGIDIISTGGTAKVLREKGIKIKEISEITKFPELLEGRVKTLHPKIQAGILAVRAKKEHLRDLEKEDIETIDLVAVNLYPFEKTISKEHKLEDAIENIDIGGVTLLRAGAKNYQDVAVVSNPKDYDIVIKELRENNLSITEVTRKGLALEAFFQTAHYDSVISEYFRRAFGHEKFPFYLNLSFEKAQALRYGENPHQEASFYKTPGFEEPCIANAKKLHGKELSYNNILDADAALELIKEFSLPACAIIKHTNPTGVAIASRLVDAYRLAYETDKVSPFGGIVAFNREVDKESAEELSKLFLEVVLAPKFSEEALEILKKKKDLRVLEVPLNRSYERKGLVTRSVVGGLLVQDRDVKELEESKFRVVTKRAPTEQELENLKFAFKVVRHCKSNALVFAKELHTVAIGLGQTSRVDCAHIAAKKGGENIRGSALASDAFFPFRDAVDVAAKFGVSAIIQPGGSVRDQEVIDACNEYEIAMVFSGMRVFRH
ncbi:MAG: bifunctional phosphoribosylaminoimidazolecarboxamide formyltransferase/IMP cyclohydrolase [Candidatus Thermoplasmatota archaeon]|nr:bifunctional phosphoribosylaminoimidazolecarboxamide formyltransferase/IMP cyclohydrolase [Candidatus Thermoplasmatota archaeon]